MTNLTSGVKFGHRETDAILLLVHSYDHLLFCDGSEWDSDVWAKSLRTLRDAKFKVSMAAVLALPGMGSDV